MSFLLTFCLKLQWRIQKEEATSGSPVILFSVLCKTNSSKASNTSSRLLSVEITNFAETITFMVKPYTVTRLL